MHERSSESVCASALKLGIRDYFPKPLSVSELRRSVRQILSGNQHNAADASADREPDIWSAPSSCRHADIAVQKAAVLIQQRYWDHLTLSSLAREVGISKYCLSRSFRGVIGITLRGFLLRTRLEKAKELLARTGDHITDVALAVGFGDLPRFDKLFKRYTGSLPPPTAIAWPQQVTTTSARAINVYGLVPGDRRMQHVPAKEDLE